MKANIDLIVVVFENQTVVFNTQNFKFRDNIPTCPNKYGLCALFSKTVISFEKDPGKLRMKNYEEEKEVVNTLDTGEKSIRNLSISFDGLLLAVAANEGRYA